MAELKHDTTVGGVLVATVVDISNKVDKIVGKQLSTEDFTSAEKTKLSGIATGAQVNSITTVAGKTGEVVVTKSDVGLSTVDDVKQASKTEFDTHTTDSNIHRKITVSMQDPIGGGNGDLHFRF